MRRALALLSPALVASLTLAACGGSSYGGGSSSSSAAVTPAPPSSQAGASGAIVRTAANASLGSTVLTNAGGMTLYSLSAEQGGKFVCTNACTQVWHPLSAPASGTPSGAASLGTVMRPDGTRQVTYKGLPLYTFAQDQRAGEAKGQGLKDVGTWSAATVSSAAAPSTGGSATSSTPAPAGRSAY